MELPKYIAIPTSPAESVPAGSQVYAGNFSDVGAGAILAISPGATLDVQYASASWDGAGAWKLTDGRKVPSNQLQATLGYRPILLGILPPLQGFQYAYRDKKYFKPAAKAAPATEGQRVQSGEEQTVRGVTNVLSTVGGAYLTGVGLGGLVPVIRQAEETGLNATFAHDSGVNPFAGGDSNSSNPNSAEPLLRGA